MFLEEKKETFRPECLEKMKIRIIDQPYGTISGIYFRRYKPGLKCDLGFPIAEYTNTRRPVAADKSLPA